MEECITAELVFLIDELGSKDSYPFNIQDLLTQSVSNVITKVVFGSRFDYTAEQLANLQFDEFFEKNRLYQGFKILRVSLLQLVQCSMYPSDT